MPERDAVNMGQTDQLPTAISATCRPTVYQSKFTRGHESWPVAKDCDNGRGVATPDEWGQRGRATDHPTLKGLTKAYPP
jgi:hypothetical protein